MQEEYVLILLGPFEINATGSYLALHQDTKPADLAFGIKESIQGNRDYLRKEIFLLNPLMKQISRSGDPHNVGQLSDATDPLRHERAQSSPISGDMLRNTLEGFQP